MKWIILSSILIFGSSCATTAPVPITINCLPALELPLLDEYQAVELQRLSHETYMILAYRDSEMQKRIEALCSIIESTH